MADLKPCPFCGASLKFKDSTQGDDYHEHPRNDCVLASVGMGDPMLIFDSTDDIAAWNRRATDGVKGPEHG